MQTTKWGPSGWNLFHNVAISYVPNSKNALMYKKFYENFKYILPCKYCRESYEKIFNQTRIEQYLHNSERLYYWTYLIHNNVNDKLRNQGFKQDANPSYASIKKYYEKKCYNECSYNDYVTFIGCVVFNYGNVGSTQQCSDECIINAYKYFFYFLHKYIPSRHFTELSNNALSSNCSLVVWYYVNVLQRNKTKKEQKKFFDDYIDYFSNMRASCSEATSCRVKLSN